MKKVSEAFDALVEAIEAFVDTPQGREIVESTAKEFMEGVPQSARGDSYVDDLSTLASLSSAVAEFAAAALSQALRHMLEQRGVDVDGLLEGNGGSSTVVVDISTEKFTSSKELEPSVILETRVFNQIAGDGPTMRARLLMGISCTGLAAGSVTEVIRGVGVAVCDGLIERAAYVGRSAGVVANIARKVAAYASKLMNFFDVAHEQASSPAKTSLKNAGFYVAPYVATARKLALVAIGDALALDEDVEAVEKAVRASVMNDSGQVAQITKESACWVALSQRNIEPPEPQGVGKDVAVERAAGDFSSAWPNAWGWTDDDDDGVVN